MNMTRVMTKEKLDELIKAIEENYSIKRVSVWGRLETQIFIECKGFTGPSKKVEKIISKLGLTIIRQLWSEGSNYSGYYYWVKE